MNIFIVSYIQLDEFGGVEFIVDKAFTAENQALEYCQEQNNCDKYKVCYVVNEVTLEPKS